jgi:hypothetical protein
MEQLAQRVFSTMKELGHASIHIFKSGIHLRLAK